MTTWALIVAVENYPKLASGWARQLPGTNQAGRDFRDWVMQVKKVPASNVIGCAEAASSWRTTGNTRQEIVDAFTNLVTRARDQANEVYIFFSGHGIDFAEDPYEPAMDLLIGSEFSDPSTSGGACLPVQEIKEKLRMALGPGRHFYFIDACRNPLGKTEISPANLGVVWGRSTLGNATTFVLFSTAPGDVAKVNSGFDKVLLSGLKGSARAKAWIGGKMYVTFDNLLLYLQRALKKDDLELEKRGPLAANSDIVELIPIPTSRCDLEVIGARPADRFTLNVEDLRNGLRPPIPFVGSQTTVSFFPEDYLFRLINAAGEGVPQIAPPPDPAGVDLYEDRKVQFQIGPAVGLPPQPPLGASARNSNVRISGPSGTEVSLQDLASGATKTLRVQDLQLNTSLEPGRYKVQLRDGNFKLRSERFDVSAGATVDLDLSPKPSRGAQRSIARTLPNDGMSIHFSETLNNVPDWDLSLWLALLGASRILAPRDMFSKLQSIALETFADATPGQSIVYILAGELEGTEAAACGVGREPRAQPMQPVLDVPGLFQIKLEFPPGPLLVTYSAGSAPTTTIATYGLPNRATLLTFARDEKTGQQIQQFILPIYSLNNQLSDRELEYLQYQMPLPMLRYMSTAQRLFALQAPIEGHTHRGSDNYWFDLLYGKWLDPVMALIACYELIRRGAAKSQKPAMQEVLGNMRKYFPGFADTEVIAMLVGEPYVRPTTAPLLMDGFIALGATDILPLGEAGLDFSSIWTSWRNALPLRETENNALNETEAEAVAEVESFEAEAEHE
jgi:Caspase domain